MKAKNSFAASITFMLMVGSVSAQTAQTDQYEIKYDGSVIENSCVINGGGTDLGVQLEPVFAKELETANGAVNMKYVDGVYSVICDGEVTAKIGFGDVVKEKSPVGNNLWGVVTDTEGADNATGVLVHTYLAIKSGGRGEFANLFDSAAKNLDLTMNADGFYTSQVNIRAGYIPRNVDGKGGVKVTPGLVKATAPIILTYQ